MKSSLRLTFALAAGLFALPVFAAAPAATTGDVRADHETGVATIRAQIAKLKGEALQKRSKAQGTSVYPGTPLANEFRAYPPSCAAWPLPDKASGPSSQIFSKRMQLYTRTPLAVPVAPAETVTVTVWRIACSSSGNETPYNTDGGFNAMTLMRIDRDAANEGKDTYYPTFPLLKIQQGSVDFNDAASLVRAASEPNTYMSDGPFDSPIIHSTTYVLENYYGPNADYQHLYSYALKLKVDPYFDDSGNTSVAEFTLPDYAPTQSTYPDAFAPLPLDGYSAAQWINTQFNEGLIVQMTEQPQSNGSTVRQLVFDLLMEDLNGDPLWLVGNAAFSVGQTNLTVQTNYLGNNLTQIPYGTAKFEVRDCNHLDVTFSANPGLPAPIPTINGLTTYDRLFTPNGMTCE